MKNCIVLKKNIKILITLLILLGSAIFFCSCSQELPDTEEIMYEPEVQPISIDEITYIAHAGGGIGDSAVTNTKEAFENAYEKGYQYLEADLELTRDGKLVLLHDWNHNYLPGYEKDDFPLTYDQFMNSKILGQYTPMSVNDLIDFVSTRPDLTIVVDMKSDFDIIVPSLAEKVHSYMDHFLIQAYDEDCIDLAKSLGFPRVLLTIYQLPYDIQTDPQKIFEIVEGKGLEAITFPKSLCEQENFVDTLKKTGLPLLVHSFYYEDDVQWYIDEGINGFYYSSLIDW